MLHKTLGRSGRLISPIGLGTVTFGREIDEKESYSIMDHALENGLTWFDTAESYGGGQSKTNRKTTSGGDDQREITIEMSSSERIIGRWLNKTGNKDSVTICTKASNGDPEKIHNSVTGSLERLGLTRLDIYKLHSPTLDVPIAETLHALTEEVEKGRIDVIGCSNFSADQLQEAINISAKHRYQRFEITQPPYNLVLRENENDLFQLCTNENICLTPHSPLGNGFLTGKYTKNKGDIPKGTRMHIAPGHIDMYWNERGWQIHRGLLGMSVRLNVPVVRLAMAWVMTNPHVTSTIIGAREKSHIDNALNAYKMGIDQKIRNEMSSWGNSS